MSDTEPELPGWLRRLIEASVAGGTTLGGLAVGGPFGAAGGAAASPILTALIIKTGTRIRERWSANAGAAIAYGADAAGLSPEDLVERLLLSPDREELFASALEAAAHATLEAKIRALGDSLRSGAVDSDAQVEVETFFVRAMVDIDAPHVRVLNAMSASRSGTTVRDLAHRIPSLEPILTPVVATLERHGAVQRIQPDVVKVMNDYEKNRSRGLGTPSTPDAAWRVTKFGVECLNRLRAAGPRALGSNADA